MRYRRSGSRIDTGILVLRIGIGIMFMLHGYPKMLGGPEMWVQVGEATRHLGIDFAPMFFGFMAAITELFGGAFLILGLFFTPTTALMFVVMVVAAASHIGSGDGFSLTSHSIELGIVFVGLMITGPGKYSMDRRMKSRSRRSY